MKSFLMPIGIEYGVISPGNLGSTDTRSYRSHWVVTGHLLCLRSLDDKIGEWCESIECISQDRFDNPVSVYEQWEPFCYWVLDD